MENVNVQLVFTKPMRCSSRIDPSHVSNRILRCYYRRSERRSKRKVLHLRRQLQKQRGITRAALPAALDEIKRLDIALKYAKKETAALQRTLPEQKKEVVREDGMDKDDFMRAVAASLRTIEEELDQEDCNSLSTVRGSVLSAGDPQEAGDASDNVEAPQAEDAATASAPSSSVDSSSKEPAAEGKSLGDQMRDEKQVLQEWMVSFCQTDCYMDNSLANLVSISDRLGQFSASLEGIIEQLFAAKEAELRATLVDVHTADIANAEAKIREESEAISKAKREELTKEFREERASAILGENTARQQAFDKAWAAKEVEAKITMEEELKLKEDQLQASMEATLKIREADIRATMEQEYAQKEIDCRGVQDKAKAEVLSADRLILEESFNKREVELRSTIDEEVREKIANGIADWKEIRGPVLQLGGLMSDRRLEKILWSTERDEDLMKRANAAAHDGSVMVDSLRFHPSLADDEASRNRDGFFKLYGVDPEFALEFRSCERLVTMLNCRATVRQCQRSQRYINFFARCDPLLELALEASSVEELDQLLSEEEHVETMTFLEKTCQEVNEMQRQGRIADYKQLANSRKDETPTPLKHTRSDEINKEYGTPKDSRQDRANWHGVHESFDRKHERVRARRQSHPNELTKLTPGSRLLDDVDESEAPNSPGFDGDDSWINEVDDEEDVGPARGMVHTSSGRGGRGGARGSTGQNSRGGRGGRGDTRVVGGGGSVRLKVDAIEGGKEKPKWNR